MEDPGTAGDQGEENWADLLRGWLPPYFEIVTKGRILTESGYVSDQVDVLVLMPSYPKILRNKKLYLAGGVAAAFECKTTLRGKDIKEAVEVGVKLRRNLTKRVGSPYNELNSSIIYGILAHSHAWKDEGSKPVVNIENCLWKADSALVRHPSEMMDCLCVSDLATWTSYKSNLCPKKQFENPEIAAVMADYASTSYLCHAVGGMRQKDFYSPLGTLLSCLFTKLAWTFQDMRSLEQYFRRVNLRGEGLGTSRRWDISIYSEKVGSRILADGFGHGKFFDEWSQVFL
jgi:hypothetical protein